MQRKVSAIEEYFVNKGIIIGEAKGRAEGEAKGEIKGEARGEAKGRAEEEARIALRFIQNRRSRYLSEFQILEDLKSDLGLDEAKARQYMDAALVKA